MATFDVSDAVVNSLREIVGDQPHEWRRWSVVLAKLHQRSPGWAVDYAVLYCASDDEFLSWLLWQELIVKRKVCGDIWIRPTVILYEMSARLRRIAQIREDIEDELVVSE